MTFRRTRRIGLLLILTAAAACDDCKDLKHFDCDLTYCVWDDRPEAIVESRFARLDDRVIATTLRRGQSDNSLSAFRASYSDALAGVPPVRDDLGAGNIFSLSRIGINPFDNSPTFTGIFNDRLNLWRFDTQWDRITLNPTTEYKSTSYSSNSSTAVATGFDPAGTINFYCQSGISSWSHCGSFSGTPQGDVIWDAYFGANKHAIILGEDNTTFLLWDRVFSDGTITSIGQFNDAKDFLCWRDIELQEPPMSGELLFETDLRLGRLNRSLGYTYWNRGLLNRYPVAGTLDLNPCFAAGNCNPNQCVLDGAVDRTQGASFDTAMTPFAPSTAIVPSQRSEVTSALGISDSEEDEEIYAAFFPRQSTSDWSSSVYKRSWKFSTGLESTVKWGTPVFDVDCLGSDCIGIFPDEMDYLQATKSRVSRRQSELNFPQLLSGGNIGSDLSVNNLDQDMEAEVKITIRDQAGALVPFTITDGLIDFSGSDYNGMATMVIPAGGKLSLRTERTGNLKISTVQVTSEKRIAGVVTFNGQFLASVQSARRLQAFSAPVRTASELNTGVAVQNLTGDSLLLFYRLCDKDGNVLATALDSVAPNGQVQRFVTELMWVPEPGVTLDFTNFDGTLKGQSDGFFAASALEGRGTQFTTVSTTPIKPLPEPES